jgi:hypothetical protein
MQTSRLLTAANAFASDVLGAFVSVAHPPPINKETATNPTDTDRNLLFDIGGGGGLPPVGVNLAGSRLAVSDVKRRFADFSHSDAEGMGSHFCQKPADGCFLLRGLNRSDLHGIENTTATQFLAIANPHLPHISSAKTVGNG